MISRDDRSFSERLAYVVKITAILTVAYLAGGAIIFGVMQAIDKHQRIQEARTYR